MKKHNIARAAVSAGLAIAMTFGGVAPATMAFAATNDGSVTIAKRADNDNTTLQGYQIFKADVADVNGKKVASNLDWASTQVKTDVETATNRTFNSAQDAADYLAGLGVADGTVVSNTDVMNKIANALRNDANLTTTTVTPGVAKTGMSTGYWLFVTSKDSTNNTADASMVDQTGTSPIFAIVGGSALEINQKANIPTVDKWVKNDAKKSDGSESDWGKVADSQVEQELNYKLVGTVANNVATYDTYYYKFTDKLSAGLTADVNSIHVKILNGTTETEITSGFKKNVASNNDATDAKDQTSTLSVEFADLKAAAKAENVTLDSNSKVIVYYNAKLDKTKAFKVASLGNPNEVYLTYSNNPNTDSKGDTQHHEVKDYTYKLNIVKQGDGTEKQKLQGAMFTIKATGADEGTTDKFVQADGSLGATAHEFSTDSNGEIHVSGLDAGTYTVSETTAPTGYNKVADFTFTITPTWNDAKTELQSLAVEEVEDNSNAVESAVSNGQVNLTVTDKAGHGLPLTGQAGVTLTFVAGALVLAFGVSRVVRNRKEQDAE